MASKCARKKPPCRLDAREGGRLCDAHWAEALDKVRKKLADTAIKPDGEAGCWLWQGAKQQNGYGYMGTFGLTDNSKPAHWMALVALEVIAVDSHGEVHHLCGLTGCINPAHLQHLTLELHELLHQLTNPRIAHTVLDHLAEAYPMAESQIEALRAVIPF